MKSLRAKAKAALHSYSVFGKIAEVAAIRKHAFNERVHEARRAVKRCQTNYEADKKKAVEKGTSVGTAVEQSAELLFLAKRRLNAMLRKREFWRARYIWANQRHNNWGLILKHRRDRLRRWVLQHQTFQPYMANGRPWEKLTPEARYGIYLDFRSGLYVTATYEGHPGDGVHSTTSGHYIENQPDGRARCWDAASGTQSKMVAGQRREAHRAGPFMIELIGPQNDLEFKNGIQYTLPEGSPLETMHDTHKHEWVRDGAPK